MSTPSRLPTDPTSRSDKARKPMSQAERIWLFVILALGICIGYVLLTQIDVNDPRHELGTKTEKSDVDKWPGRNKFKSKTESSTTDSNPKDE